MDAECHDCRRPYADGGFQDLIIPYWAWKRISPTGDEGGLLCPSCICSRLHIEGIQCEGAFMSGPIESVSRPTMAALRGLENIELAIEGRNNHWADVRELIKPRFNASRACAIAAESGVTSESTDTPSTVSDGEGSDG